MSIHVFHSGANRTMKAGYVFVSGANRPIKEIWIYHAGANRLVYPSSHEPLEAVFVVGSGEAGWGYFADPEYEMGTLVSSTFDDPTLYGIYSSSGSGGQVNFEVIGSGPVPADAFTAIEIYSGSAFGTLELSLDISDAATVAFGNHRIWSWTGVGNFFSGKSGNTFGIRAVKI